MQGMRIAYISLALLFILGLSAGAQMDQDQQMASSATVQPGPQLRPGLPFSADVFVNGRFAMRIPAYAGGLSPMRRAEIIANRLNQAFAEGASWQDMRIAQVEGLWTVSMNGRLIATADINSARAYGTSTGQLASRWARQSVVAIGGQPQMIAQQLDPVQVAVAGEQQEIGAPPSPPMPAAPAWATTPTRSVPLLDAETGSRIGTVMVAGPAGMLNAANAVVLYTTDADGGTAYLMVPITGTSTTGTITRANGVGVVSIPSSLIPEGIMAGAQLPQFDEERLTGLENTITDELRDRNVATGASAAVVPLYSRDMNQVIGTAHIIGNAAQVGRAQAVVESSADNMLQFQAVADAPPVTGAGQALNNVVLSGIVLWRSETPAEPEATTPDAGESQDMQDGGMQEEPETTTEPGTPGSNF